MSEQIKFSAEPLPMLQFFEPKFIDSEGNKHDIQWLVQCGEACKDIDKPEEAIPKLVEALETISRRYESIINQTTKVNSNNSNVLNQAREALAMVKRGE